VRAAAYRKLAEISGNAAALHVANAVARVDLESEPVELASIILLTYALLKPKEAFALLEPLIKKGQAMLASKAAQELAVAAITAMSAIRTPRAIEVLAKVGSTRNQRMKNAAAKAIERLKKGGA
jgi:hypothetical protein